MSASNRSLEKRWIRYQDRLLFQ